MRKVIALLPLLLCSCHGQPSGGEAQRLPVMKASAGGEETRVALGDPADVAQRRILQSGGREAVGTGALYLGPGDLKWYDLKDGTTVALRFEAAEGQNAKVTRIVSGEPGRGYDEKKKWFSQSREVDSIELR